MFVTCRKKNPKGVKNPVPGVALDKDFKPTYKIIKGKAATVTELKRLAEKGHQVSGWQQTFDREGEAIAWHLAEALEVIPQNANRVVFNAITKSEIEKAFLHPRPINMEKVNAQQARRILDRIVGVSGFTFVVEKSSWWIECGSRPISCGTTDRGKGT